MPIRNPDWKVEEVPEGKDWAPAEVREDDALNYPHDEPCPDCGRRQWTDEYNQTTCQACGGEFDDDDFN